MLIINLIKNDNNLIVECGFLKNDISRLNKKFEKILMEEKDEYLEFIKNEEESIIEMILNK